MMHNSQWLIAPLAVVGALGFWCLICLLISLCSGWNKLARHFRVQNRPQARIFPMQSAYINAGQYKGCLVVGIAAEGLYLSVWSIFRVGHAPLLIPWRELEPFKTEKTLWLSTYKTKIRLGRFDSVSIAFFSREVVTAMEAQMPQMTNGHHHE